VLYLKHLLRGVSLGLFDEAAAMEKFTKWTAEHEANINRRKTAHKKARAERSNAPVVKKVAPAQTEDVPSPAEVAQDAASEETKPEE
jgi:small subunit ribosomal protein S16